MTFERGFCPTCGVIDGKVVKSPPMPPPVPGWGEVGPNFDRCIIKVLLLLYEFSLAWHTEL